MKSPADALKKRFTELLEDAALATMTIHDYLALLEEWTSELEMSIEAAKDDIRRLG